MGYPRPPKPLASCALSDYVAAADIMRAFNVSYTIIKQAERDGYLHPAKLGTRTKCYLVEEVWAWHNMRTYGRTVVPIESNRKKRRAR